MDRSTFLEYHSRNFYWVLPLCQELAACWDYKKISLGPSSAFWPWVLEEMDPETATYGIVWEAIHRVLWKHLTGMGAPERLLSIKVDSWGNLEARLLWGWEENQREKSFEHNRSLETNRFIAFSLFSGCGAYGRCVCFSMSRARRKALREPGAESLCLTLRLLLLAENLSRWVTQEKCQKLQFPFKRDTNGGRWEQNLKTMLHYIPQTVCLDFSTL